MTKNDRFVWKVSPKANEKSMLIGKNYRFTALTDRLIRLEYSYDGVFEDRASQVVFHRDFPECEIKSKVEDGVVTAETKEVIITYTENADFSNDTLKIKLKGEPASSWSFGDEFETLGGTARTLDCINGRCAVDKGVISRNGFSVIDDSESICLGEDGWVELRNKGNRDIYFFGYGYNYLDAIKDFYRLTGAPPMLPAYALGNWWSRYYAYTQQEYIDLMERFKAEDVPFSVAVIDMDWHITKVPEEVRKLDISYFTNGWTGYSWNKELFPDHKAFLKNLHDKNLKTALNLHPASGVAAHEDMYEEMAKACGIDPATKKRVPFNVLSKEFMENYFDILHHPHEEDGVDFWWMDWQQGTDYRWLHWTEGYDIKDEREKADPLWMLNHLHILDISRNGKRPMFFSRYSGHGSHRYPVGFSGDTYVTWESLDFQPEFTATASNVGYSWWSHDIGGHCKGYANPELVIRWMQLGVFSPINRLHSTNDPFVCKEPWAYGEKYEPMMKSCLRLRHQLFPYIYTMNYRNHKDLEPTVQPMYYRYPKNSDAYSHKNQFMFGSELMVCPITEPCDDVAYMAKATGWLPKGDWFDFFSGLHYKSKGRTMDFYRSLEDYPVFAKAGAIVPMNTHKAGDNTLGSKAEMDIYVFPAADNSFTLYEDEGEYSNYEKGAFSTTEMSLSFGEEAVFTINAAKGDTSIIPEERKWNIHLRGFNKDIKVNTFVNGKEVKAQAIYDAETLTTVLTVTAKTRDEVRLEITGESLITDNGDIRERMKRLIVESRVPANRKNELYEAVNMPNPQYGSLSNYRRMHNTANLSYEERYVVEAIRERLTLLADLYEGWGGV
ncbi:MAG: DUF5110 domain-containing protein [Clostridia bacterium]|nr:DUF5110 domain-containing protein [Clostridia bacterium]